VQGCAIPKSVLFVTTQPIKHLKNKDMPQLTQIKIKVTTQPIKHVKNKDMPHRACRQARCGKINGE